jgi:hypothetical protein
MLLNALKVINSRGSMLNLPLEDDSAGFQVQKIEGLDPVKAILVSSSFAGMDGEQYHSSRREARNIKLTLGLSPDYGTQAVKDLRDLLYQYFMPKQTTQLIFHMYDKFATDVFHEFKDIYIDGRIESFDSELFVAEPSVDVSAMCFNPDFYEPDTVIFNGNTVADTTTETTLAYGGTIDTGAIFTLHPNRAITDFTIYHTTPEGTVRTLYISHPLLAGDTLEISSVVGSKYVRLTRASVQSSVLYAMSPQSAWLTLEPGDNKLRVYTEGAPIPYDIQYTTKYGGL